jgi:glycosyltransferase 2 family protein
MIDDRSGRKSGWVKHLIGAGVTILCLVVFFRQINFSEVLQALAQFRWPYLILGIASLAFGYGLRIVRWSMMLRATGASIGYTDCAAPFLGSIALNNILPLRLGDVVRALVFPQSMGISRTTATTSLVVERLIDLMTLLASLAIGLFAIQSVVIPAGLKNSAVSLALIGGVALALGFIFSKALGRFFSRLSSATNLSATNPRLARIYATAGGLLTGFDMMSRPHLLLAMLGVSMFIWAGESGLFYFVLLGLGIAATPITALLVMAIATLSTLVPSSPGYVGPFHLAAFTATSLVGGTAAQAGSYAVLVHLALWLPTTIAGALAIWTKPELFRAARRQPA